MRYGNVISFAAVFLLTFLCGCFSAAPETPEERSFSLHDALKSARKKHLEVNAFELVQKTASEYSDHQRALYLDELISDGRGNTVSPEILRSFLEEAIIYNHLLGGSSEGADPVKTQSVRSGQLLDWAVAAAAVRLQCAILLYELGEEKMRQEISECEMELRNLTGASPVEIACMDLQELPKPYPLKTPLIALQQFAAFNRPESAGTVLYPDLLDDVKSFFDGTQVYLRYSRVLYSFPEKLSSRRLKPADDPRKVIRLANAAGIVLLLEEDFKALNEAFDAWRLEELRLKVVKNPSPEQRKKLILLTRDWLLCFLRLRTTVGVTDFDLPIPELTEQNHPELTNESALFFEIISENLP